jgi:hypothetical protein
LHARFLCAWPRVQIPWGSIEHGGSESTLSKTVGLVLTIQTRQDHWGKVINVHMAVKCCNTVKYVLIGKNKHIYKSKVKLLHLHVHYCLSELDERSRLSPGNFGSGRDTM